MKKILLSALFIVGLSQKSQACGWYDPDYDYFNLFTQESIHNPYYAPFLLSYSNVYYTDNNENPIDIPDENIENWVQYFHNELSYDETKALVNVIQLKHFQSLTKGKLTHQLFQKLGANFYTKYKEGLDYLTKAKELEPYMRVKIGEDSNSYYWSETSKKELDATKLNYAKTLQSLNAAYKTATEPEIKLRYAYQIVRFNHYTLHYTAAVTAFDSLVEPLKLKSPIYYYALDQKAGAQRGLGKLDQANWNFFQVFKNSKNKKESAYNSMFLAKEKDFESLLKKAKTPEDQNMAYFLLAYNNYNNPVPILKKMLANNSQSDILKVLTARGINELERNYLKTNPYCQEQNCDKHRNQKLPFYFTSPYEKDNVDFAKDLETFIIEAKAKNKTDVFWDIADAYIKFLKGDYKTSDSILAQVKTEDKDYQKQVSEMRMLNDIVSQPKMTPEFENLLMTKYKSLFVQNPQALNYNDDTSTIGFVTDILANRYFIEQQDAKSYLLNNKLSDLQYNPNSDMVKKVEAFYDKPNKTAFELYLTKKMEDITDPKSFFNVIYGDRAMRLGDFAKAKSFYQKANNFKGIPRIVADWNNTDNTYKEKPLVYEKGIYNGYDNISALIFGHNVWESFGSAAKESMKSEGFNFSFIKDNMNKVELADALIQLQNIAKSNTEEARQANQLIGNLLYNTSILGYYREVFLMDIDNSNGGKFDFTDEKNPPFYFYYKNFASSNSIEPDNFDLSINYYKKALQLSKNKEDQTRILFQMSSAEQGKYYQWESSKANFLKWDDPDYDKKSEAREALLNKTKNQSYRQYFAELKKNYAQTKTYKDLQSSCLYFNYYTTKK